MDITFGVRKFGNSESLDFFKFVDKNCKAAIKRIIIYDADYEALSNWTYSFDHKTTDIGVLDYLRDTLPLNDLFPNMQALTMKHLKDIYVRHYPNLHNFSLIAASSDNDRNPNVNEFVRLNPQLRSVHTVMRNNASYIAYLNEMLPNLQSLSIEVSESYDIVSNQRAIHFKNVRKFILKLDFIGEQYETIANVTFDQLDTFVLYDSVHMFGIRNEVIKLILNNRNLRAFRTNKCLSNGQILRLVYGLPELEEISIGWASKRPNLLNSIFNAKHPKLKRINVCYKYDTAGIEWVADIIPATWRMERNEGRQTSFSLIRRNPENDGNLTPLSPFNSGEHMDIVEINGKLYGNIW